jgi:pimeloyl-ACP methyl ester carboxylesterase
MMQQVFVEAGGTRLECFTFGDRGQPPVAIDVCLAGSAGEWFHVAQELAAERFVILSHRAGYGRSGPPTRERSPGNLAGELRGVVHALAGKCPVTLLGHSFGGLVAQAYARSWPDEVGRLVLADPMSFRDTEFRERLSPEEYAASGVDKSANLRLGKVLCGLGLGWLFRPLLRRAPPFYYKPDFSVEAARAILSNATSARMYRAALEEYRLARDPAARAAWDLPEPAGNFPLVLVTHASAGMVEDIMHYGGADHATATKVEKVWQELMCATLALSPQKRWLRSGSGSHFIHLTDWPVLREALLG